MYDLFIGKKLFFFKKEPATRLIEQMVYYIHITEKTMKITKKISLTPKKLSRTIAPEYRTLIL